MLKAIKSVVPMPMKQALYPIKDKTYDQWQKKRLFKRMQVKHAELIEQIKGKQKIKVVFLAMHESVWKVDPVFKKMLADSFFEPEILVCPYTVYGEERMLKDMEQAYNYFSNKNYPVQKSIKDDGSWITLDELKPDIVFFTNPHNLTRKEYYEDAYLNYLSCYCGYGMPISKYGNYQEQYNQKFHNSVWNIFVQTQEMINNYIEVSVRQTKGVYLVGDNTVELLEAKSSANGLAWHDKKSRLKVIYAPHHSINSNEPLSIGSFLKNGEFLKLIATQYSENIYWSFKPHPLLKSRLYLHKDWGKDKTDQYYKFWELSDFSQLDNGEYIDLFLNSDAMILDSSSFLGEYLFTKKPLLYLMKEKTWDYMSNFGKNCLDASYQANNQGDISRFIQSILSQEDPMIDKRLALINDYKSNLKSEETTSQLIINHLKSNIRNH